MEIPAFMNYKVSDIFELFKQSYAEQFKSPLTIGQDEFSVASVFAYCLSVLINQMNDNAKDRFFECASGEVLDGIAASYGLKRPVAKAASAVFKLARNLAPECTIKPGELVIETTTHDKFSNVDELYLMEGDHTPEVTLECNEIGSQYNGMNVGGIWVLAAAPTGSGIQSGENITESNGGSDECSYTDKGDALFREYIKEQREGYLVGGCASAYISKAMSVDKRIKDVFCFKDGDDGFVRGLVRLVALYDIDLHEITQKRINERIKESCSDEAFKPIGDTIIVESAEFEDLTISGSRIILVYPKKFESGNTAEAHYNRVMKEYRKYLMSGFGINYSESELSKRFITPDKYGVYALSVDDTTRDARYVIPSISHVINLEYPSFQEIKVHGYVKFIDSDVHSKG